MADVAMPFDDGDRAVANTSTRYGAENGAIIGRDLRLYNNRPLYCNNTDAFVLTGDRPLMRLAHSPFIYGAFMLAVSHHDRLTWLKDYAGIRMDYRGNMTTWTLTDSSAGLPEIRLSVVPMSGEIGMAIHAEIEEMPTQDRLIWFYGGIEYHKEESLSWKLDINGHPELGQWDFVPASCKNNRIEIFSDKACLYFSTDSIAKSKAQAAVEVMCSAEGRMAILDAENLQAMQRVSAESANRLPVASGMIELNDGLRDVYWSIRPIDAENGALPGRVPPQTAWQRGMRRIEELSSRIMVQTPDARLNALASASAAVIDALWYDPVYVHGAMLWNVPFPGWRTLYGGAMYGWHDRVKKEARYYIASQITNSSKRHAKADSSLLLTLQDQDSRFYGNGRIEKDQMFYNFQSQFFDQLITAWRHTGDRELEQVLQPALELHLQWQEECFDPDGDGVFESYVNGWPTDSQWYHGGGTAEETSYAYRGHQAAQEMASRKGDLVLAAHHAQKLENIRKGFFSKLWIEKKGFAGAYREQGGYGRLHEDPWLYSIFLPIDAGLVNREQAIGSLYYTQSVLQNDRMPAGGRRVWTSNWVPGIWSVRELYPGDNYHLALAYFLSGMGDDGWDILQGTFYEGAFNSSVPGDLGTKNGGTDFNDCAGMFTRVLVEGLFGYRPDYPNNRVTLSPQLPNQWENASIRTPDFAFRYLAEPNRITAVVHLKKSASTDFYLPVRVTGIHRVLINGQPCRWELLPGLGCSVLHLQLPAGTDADIKVYPVDMIRSFCPIRVEKNIYDPFPLTFVEARIASVTDPQKVLTRSVIKDGRLSAAVSNNSGDHTLLVNVVMQKAPQTRIVYVHVTDPGVVKKESEKTLSHVPLAAEWECLNISDLFNADVRTIFQQKYLSPRPNTVSVRIGSDGYSPWTFLFWKQSPPVIGLDSIPFLLKNRHQLMTKQQVPFYWNDDTKNIAFTSLWDNWPDRITAPVNRQGAAVWLLICGSTNPMQCHIANAHLLLDYADGSTDTLALVPPRNYWNLTPIDIKAGAAGQLSRGDYTHTLDRFCVPKPWPATVLLGQNCRAMLLNRRLKSGIELQSITLQALSQEVVVGLMGISILK
jgi:hypothetical protein